MEKHIEGLVVTVLVAAALVLVIMIGVMMRGITDQSSDVACATSVATRAQAVFLTDLDVPLTGCDTRTLRITDDVSDKEIRNRIVNDFAWCRASFAPAQRVTLLEQQDVFCHVCAYYTVDGVRTVEGLTTGIQKATGISVGAGEGEYQEIGAATETLAIEDNLSIIFYQARVDAHPRLVRMYDQWMGGTAGVAAGWLTRKVLLKIPFTRPLGTVAVVGGALGGYLFGEQMLGGAEDIRGDIFIGPLSGELVNELGCTTTDVRVQGALP